MKNQLNGTISTGIFNLPLVKQIEVHDNHFFGELSFEFSANMLGILTLLHYHFSSSCIRHFLAAWEGQMGTKHNTHMLALVLVPRLLRAVLPGHRA
jgi:hypothetical protein